LNAFTVDVEEYFQVHNFESRIRRDQWSSYESRLGRGVDRLLELLDRHGTRATFFVLTWHAEHWRPIVRTIHRAGHEVASHGCEHRLVYQQTAAEFAEDVRRSKALLEDTVGEPVIGYRAPSYSVTARSMWALAELHAAGFLYDSSIYPMKRGRYGVPHAPRHPHRRPEGIVEFPLPTWRVLGRNVPAAAGAYLRVFPLALSFRALRQLNGADHPAALNVHPWELDPEQPRVRGGHLGGVTHYLNLHRTADRLDELLSTFRFGTMRDSLTDAGYLDRSDARPGMEAP
jgi:polysaccharide deacetylase family protein (PEP-CTERM system associated)